MSEAGHAGPAGAPREALSLIHHHPGRLRVRAEVFRSDQPGDAAHRVRAALEAEPGITAVLHKPKTGSLLVEYQPGLADPEAILARIAGAAGLDPPADDALARRREPALVAIDTARELNGLVYELTGYQADLRAIVPAGLAALAAYSFAFHKDERLPRWDNLLYWSYNVFWQLHRHEIDAGGGATRPAWSPGPPRSGQPEPGAASAERPAAGDKPAP